VVERRHQHGLRLLTLVLLAGALAACDTPDLDGPAFQVPCDGAPASGIEFDNPTLNGEVPEPGRFVTTGGTIYVMPAHFVRGAIFDAGEYAITAVNVGGDGITPTDIEPDGSDTGIVRLASLHEREYGRMALVAGTYWLVSTNTATIELLSCTPGALTVVAAPTPAPRSS
jgi:hypothetical protein